MHTDTDLPNGDLIGYFMRYEKRRGRSLKLSASVREFINQALDRRLREAAAQGLFRLDSVVPRSKRGAGGATHEGAAPSAMEI